MPKPAHSLVLATLLTLLWLFSPALSSLAPAQETAEEAIAREATSPEPAAEAAAPIAETASTEGAAAAAAPEAAEFAAHEAETVHAASEGAHGEAGDHESAGYAPEQWRDFFYRILNFVVYVGVLFFLLRKPVASFLNGRREGIARQVEYLETQARNYEEQAKVMRRQLDELALEREETIKRYEAEGAKERDRIIEEAKKAAELIVQRTQAAMDQELKAVRRDLVVATGRTALAMARDMLAKTVTSEDRVRLTHEFVEQVVKLPAKN
jgi:F-type H+-transporting ATPase subunit b